jgi:D-alanine transaminase
MSGVAYVNGAFVDEIDGHIRFDDRGLVFADGLYEVVRCYAGVPFRLEAHLERLRAGAAMIRLNLPPEIDGAEALIAELAERNGVAGGAFGVYLQVTRGAGTRAHVFPEDAEPTVIAWVLAMPPDSQEITIQRAITAPDRRWEMCNVKSTGLLLNVLAKQAAADAGVWEALFVRDGVVTEGAATNFFGVSDSTVYTHPEGSRILPGITRTAALELLEQQGVTVVQEPCPAERLPFLEEAFVTGSGSEITPIVEIDGRTVGDGGIGPITRGLVDGFRKLTREPASEALGRAAG